MSFLVMVPFSAPQASHSPEGAVVALYSGWGLGAAGLVSVLVLYCQPLAISASLHHGRGVSPHPCLPPATALRCSLLGAGEVSLLSCPVLVSGKRCVVGYLGGAVHGPAFLNRGSHTLPSICDWSWAGVFYPSLSSNRLCLE